MSDFISKKELYHKLGEAYNHCLITWGENEIIKDIIGECNSVENKGEWIPVSSGELPKIGQRVLATIETYDDGLTIRQTIYDKYGFTCGNATAWMPLPEVYKAEKGGE